jgi:hypothetical protein
VQTMTSLTGVNVIQVCFSVDLDGRMLTVRSTIKVSKRTTKLQKVDFSGDD